MGMPITIEVNGTGFTTATFEKVFAYFTYVDETFSTYKRESEISQINRGLLAAEDYSKDMKGIFALAEETKRETKGYFNIVTPDGRYDPSGIVKGWAIERAARILEEEGCENFYIEAGGDIQTRGTNKAGKPWQIGIRNPFKTSEIIKVLALCGGGVATSGTYLRGQHIYDPHKKKPVGGDVVSLTVVARTVYEADRYATAAFAMGREGIQFIEELPGCEGYLVDQEGLATMTSGFNRFVSQEQQYA